LNGLPENFNAPRVNVKVLRANVNALPEIEKALREVKTDNATES